MNLSYLYNVINLYIQREKSNKCSNLMIEKKDDVIVFNFSMSNIQDKTFITLPLDIVLANQSKILNLYKQDKIVIEEKYNEEKYLIKFNNGRILQFKGFSLLEINNWRNSLYNISIRQDEIRINPNMNLEQKLDNYHYQFKMGFTSYLTLFVSVLLITLVLVGSLFITRYF